VSASPPDAAAGAARARPLRIAHVVPLRAVGGVERSFAEFIAQRGPGLAVEHAALVLGRGIPPLLDATVRAAAARVELADFRDGRHLAFEPPELRERNLERILRELDPDLALFWNKPMGADLARLSASLPVLYWERGRSWKETDAPRARAFLRGVRAVLCNSEASRRFVQLRWGLPERIPVYVCPNAVRPESAGAGSRPRAAPRGRALRLGFAGRLVAVKGVPLAIHALAELARRGLDCELAIAGEGPDRDALARLAAALGVARRVRFEGLVARMPEFYRDIDCLLCPSLREPFGLVAVEALANGCPVIGSRVDGLAEVLDEGGIGIGLVPELPLARYRALGGDPEAIPREVYDPVADALAAPRVLDPLALADAVLELLRDAEGYRERSRRGIELAAARFDFASHVRQVLSILRAFARA